MNYSNMIEDKTLKKGFIIATLCSTIIGTLNASMTLHDKFQEKTAKKVQKQTDMGQDDRIEMLKDKLERIQDTTRQIKDPRENKSTTSRRRCRSTSPSSSASISSPSSRSRSSSRSTYRQRNRRRRRSLYDQDDDAAYFASHAERPKAPIKRAYHEQSARVESSGRTRSVPGTKETLQSKLVQLQQANDILQHAMNGGQRLSKHEVDRLVRVQTSARESAIAAMQSQEEVLHPRPQSFAAGPRPRSVTDGGRLQVSFDSSRIPVGGVTYNTPKSSAAAWEGPVERAQAIKNLTTGRGRQEETSDRRAVQGATRRQIAGADADVRSLSTMTVVSGRTARPERQSPRETERAGGPDQMAVARSSSNQAVVERRSIQAKTLKNEVSQRIQAKSLRHEDKQRPVSQSLLTAPLHRESSLAPRQNVLRRDPRSQTEADYDHGRTSASVRGLLPRRGGEGDSKWHMSTAAATSRPIPPTNEVASYAIAKALPAPPSTTYCTYSRELQANDFLPFYDSFRSNRDYRCPACRMCIPVDSRDVWVMTTHDLDSRTTQDYRMNARFVVKSHTPEGDFACLLCRHNRHGDRILSSYEKLIEHLATDHCDPQEFERDCDFVRLKSKADAVQPRWEKEKDLVR